MMNTPSDKSGALVKNTPIAARLSQAIIIGSLCLAWLVMLPQSLHAQQADARMLRNADNSVCVICNEPGKVYQCYYHVPADVSPASENQYIPNSEVKKVERVAPVNVRGLQFACIQEIAQYGSHGQCAAARKTAAECGGEPYDLKQTEALKTDDVVTTDGQAEGNGEAVKVVPIEPKPTLVDETQKTYKKTTETVKKGIHSTADTVESGYKTTTKTVKKTVNKVGDTIGHAAKTTYNCLTSFFQKCGK